MTLQTFILASSGYLITAFLMVILGNGLYLLAPRWRLGRLSKKHIAQLYAKLDVLRWALAGGSVPLFVLGLLAGFGET